MNIGTSKVPRHQRVRPVTSCHAKETKIRHARLFLFWSLPRRSAPVAARPTNVSFTSYDVSATNSGGAGDGLGFTGQPRRGRTRQRHHNPVIVATLGKI